MTRLILLSTLTAALSLDAVVPAAAQQTWRVGGSSNVAWSAVTSLNVMGDEDTAPGAVQPWELRPDVNVLPRINEHFGGYWDRWQFPFNPFWESGIPRLWRGPGNFQFVAQFQPAATYVDGDRQTILWQSNFGPGGNKSASEYYTIDMGAPLPVERFELHLPPEFLPDGSPNPECCDRFGTPWNRYVPHQGELTGVKEETARLINESLGKEDRNFLYDDFNYQPLEVHLGEVEEHLIAPIIVEFPLQHFRFVRWRTWPDEYRRESRSSRNGRPNCCYGILFDVGYGEMELYGRGFAGEMRLKTEVQDLGQPSTLGRINVGISKWRREGSGWVETIGADGNVERTWEVGDLVEAPDADVEVVWRLKTGTKDDPHKFLTWNDQGELYELPRAEWEDLRERSGANDPEFLGWRGPVIEDRDDWSAWTGPMNLSGTLLDVASRQYFQLEITTLSSDIWEMARLDSISIEYFPLLAPTLVGEVGLPDDDSSIITEVAIGEPTEFIYALSAEFQNQQRDGFDILQIETPSTPEFISLTQGEELQPVELDPATDVQADALGLTIRLPELVTSDQKFQVAFTTSMYTVATSLRGSVFNSDNTEIRQRVEEGDATGMIATNRLAVIASGDAVRDVLKNLAIEPPVFTPNNDGINDNLRFVYSLFGITDADVEIAIYSLSGSSVHRIDRANMGGGEHANLWDGRNRTGALVDPGIYLARVTAKTGRGEFEITRPFAVAY